MFGSHEKSTLEILFARNGDYEDSVTLGLVVVVDFVVVVVMVLGLFTLSYLRMICQHSQSGDQIQ